MRVAKEHLFKTSLTLFWNNQCKIYFFILTKSPLMTKNLKNLDFTLSSQQGENYKFYLY
jgi:hypothetical protein